MSLKSDSMATLDQSLARGVTVYQMECRSLYFVTFKTLSRLLMPRPPQIFQHGWFIRKGARGGGGGPIPQ